MMKYPRIFEPVKLGSVYFKNRVFAAPAGRLGMAAGCLAGSAVGSFAGSAAGCLAGSVAGCFAGSAPGCFAGPLAAGHYGMMARGGVASVCVPGCICLDGPLALPGLAAIAAAITRHGCVASAELSHGGKFQCMPGAGAIAYGPVMEISPSGQPILEMPEEAIFEAIEAFGRGAGLAKRCGFEMVTVQGGRGLLLAQFMSDRANTRKDRWGGTLENRMRLPLLAVESVRRHVGKDFPIEFRMSGDECHDGGYGIEYGMRIAKALDGKVDLISVSAGGHETENGFLAEHPGMFMDEGANARFAEEIKKHVKTPVATAGGLSDPKQMEEIIESGKADIVQLARQLLVDPDTAGKARAGREDDAHRCLRCGKCLSGAMENGYARCAINPGLEAHGGGPGLEAHRGCSVARPQAAPKRVLVAGGGVAGMQAALAAAERGHEVVLCEKAGRLGGALNAARGIPFKSRVTEYLDRQARKIARANIDVRLNTEATPELAAELRPDAIIVCAGSAPVTPHIKGVYGANAVSAEEASADPSRIGKRVAVMGACLAGLETAIWLAMLGRKVTVIKWPLDAGDGNTENGNAMHCLAIAGQLEKYSIPVELVSKVAEITPSGLAAIGPDGNDVLYKADTIVYVAARRPLWEAADALMRSAPWVGVAGDARSPRDIADATREAWQAALDIGT